MKEIQTTHNTENVACDEYYTPIEFVNALGHFDTDPCVPLNMKNKTAYLMYNKNDDGLSKEWFGKVWLNPPYSAELIKSFMAKMALHGNGIALVLPKFGTRLFRESVYPYADGIYVLRHRIKFFNEDWVQQKSPIASSVLIAYGKENVDAILNSGIEGTMLYLKH